MQEQEATLINESLVENPFAVFEDKADFTIPVATLQIYSAILSCRKESTEVNRASSAPMPPCRRWHQRKGFPAQPLTPSKELNFKLGDIVEAVIVHYISIGNVGKGNLYSEVFFGERESTFTMNQTEYSKFKQIEWTTHIGNIEVKGHPDGIGKRHSDGQWELIEVKSMSNYGFKDFKHVGKNDYIAQAHALMCSREASELGIGSVRFFSLRKETGHLHDNLYEFNEGIADKMREDFRIVMRDECPTRIPLIPEIVKKLPTGYMTNESWRCSYCPYQKPCREAEGYVQIVDWTEKVDQHGNRTPKYRYKKKEKAHGMA